eukprot:Em0021g191a
MKAAIGIFVALFISSSLAKLGNPALTEQWSEAKVGLVVTIESVQFPGVFLRMDGGSVTSFNGAGAGTVNCQYGAGPYEMFVLRAYSGDQFSIESLSSFQGRSSAWTAAL